MLTLFLHFLCIVVHFSSASARPLEPLASARPMAPLAPALYVFGDSLLDNGNNNLLPTLARSNYPPYGVDFAHGATGRFTNGRNTVDFIAEYLGLPYSPPALGFPRRDWLTGFNYASGACGILNDTGSNMGKVINLGEQIKLFEGTIKHVLKRRYRNPEKLSLYMSKSIFVLFIGNNDYLYHYLMPNIRPVYGPPQFTDILMDHLSQKLQRLYQLGARKVLVFELGPIGCAPSVTRTTIHDGEQCNEEINRMVSLFNDGLGPMLSNLTSRLVGSHFTVGRVHGLGYDAIMNPSKYGLTNTIDPCCIGWFNGTQTCIPLLPTCSNRDQFFFWDGYHLTETMCSVIASQCITDSSICTPFNIQQLVQL